MKTIAVIPTYNEENTIAQVVKDTQNHCDDIIVVDNNSTDKTAVKAYESVVGGIFVFEEYTQGAGAATRKGIGKALELGADIVITLDGDGQHNPAHIPWLLSPFSAEHSPDIVIGSRFWGKGNKIPLYRSFGIKIITWLFNVGAKHKITDSQCGFRAFSRKTLESIGIEENGFGFSIEMLVKARKKGLWIVEVPITCVYHGNLKQNSTLNPIRHGLGVALKTIKWRIWEIRES